MLFETEGAKRLSVTPLLDESLFLIGSPNLAGMPCGKQVRLKAIGALPLVMPSGSHGLTAIVATAFAKAGCEPNIVADIDGLAILMDAVRAGLAATIQPGAASSRLPADALRLVRVTDAGARRRNLLASLSDDELSPAALAARVVLGDVVRSLVAESQWVGASLLKA